MVLKLKHSGSSVLAESKRGHGKDDRKKAFSKIEALYMALMCFTTHCLSCITLEAGGRTSLGGTMTKSAAFNALFWRTYNLKIMILVTQVIAGMITTLMMTLADKYGIPYLYLPWLVNTMQGMALCEGPALLILADVILPNFNVPTATFILITFFLYVEQLFIWNGIFKKCLHCWNNYHNQEKCIAERSKVKRSTTRKKKLFRQGDAENNINIGKDKLKNKQKPMEYCEKADSRISMNIRIRPIQSAIENNDNFLQNQLSDMTG